MIFQIKEVERGMVLSKIFNFQTRLCQLTSSEALGKAVLGVRVLSAKLGE